MPKYQDMLMELMLDQLTEQGGYIDLDMISERLQAECPGPYELRWINKVDWNMVSMHDILNDVKIEFKDQTDKIEWLLKWS